jgi:hypothetical protein
MCVTRDPRLFARTDLPARAGNTQADTDVDGHEYAYRVPYPLPYPDLDSNAAATHKDAGPHGQPDVDADGYTDADRHVDAGTDEHPDAGLPRRPYPTSGAVRRSVTNA